MIECSLARSELLLRIEQLRAIVPEANVSPDVLNTRLAILSGYGRDDFEVLLTALAERRYDHPTGWFMALRHLVASGQIRCIDDAAAAPAAGPTPLNPSESPRTGRLRGQVIGTVDQLSQRLDWIKKAVGLTWIVLLVTLSTLWHHWIEVAWWRDVLLFIIGGFTSMAVVGFFAHNAGRLAARRAAAKIAGLVEDEERGRYRALLLLARCKGGKHEPELVTARFLSLGDTTWASSSAMVASGDAVRLGQLFGRTISHSRKISVEFTGGMVALPWLSTLVYLLADPTASFVLWLSGLLWVPFVVGTVLSVRSNVRQARTEARYAGILGDLFPVGSSGHHRAARALRDSGGSAASRVLASWSTTDAANDARPLELHERTDSHPVESPRVETEIPRPPAPSPTPRPRKTPERTASGERRRKRKPIATADNMSDADAVFVAYSAQIEQVASMLSVGLSILVRCDKIIVQHLWEAITSSANLSPTVLGIAESSPSSGGFFADQISGMRQMFASLDRANVLVVPNLDLLAGGSSYPSEAAREFTEMVYRASNQAILAFADPSLEIPEVLASRFAIRMSISGVTRTTTTEDGEVETCDALLSAQQINTFADYDPGELYRNVSGMNAIQIRRAITYAINESDGDGPISMDAVKKTIQAFKARASVKFEVPDVGFDQIGGYGDVKNALKRAIFLIRGRFQLPDESVRKDLMPKGFILYGPPGTGKTLFAKAVANELDATVMVVSGPEIVDKYVGESERKIREVFTEARRNAPAVIVFDEFDAIASERSTGTDGGARVNNSMVAQILTEMDGFRAEAPVLVLGTTNRLEIVDEAFLRPGRFQAIGVPLPREQERLAIARIYAQKFGIELPADVLKAAATALEGCSGDEIRAVFKEACIDAFCTHPPILATPARLGELVGQVRRSKERHVTTRSSQAPGGRTGNRLVEETMVTLVPHERAAPRADTDPDESQDHTPGDSMETELDRLRD